MTVFLGCFGACYALSAKAVNGVYNLINDKERYKKFLDYCDEKNIVLVEDALISIAITEELKLPHLFGKMNTPNNICLYYSDEYKCWLMDEAFAITCKGPKNYIPKIADCYFTQESVLNRMNESLSIMKKRCIIKPMQIVTNSQFGNCIFRLAAAIKFYGKENITGVVINDPYLTNVKFRNTIEQLTRLVPNMSVSARSDDPFNILWMNESYWQSLDSIPSREECRKLFTVPAVTPPDRPVIHLRWEDYKYQPNSKPTKVLLEKAAERLGCKISDFIVCTNDPEFIKTLGITDDQITYNCPWDDFKLMCAAKKLVIYPSTFSWWAGFLGKHERVLFPEGFGPWDSKLLVNDKYSANSNRELCWGEECEMLNINE